MNVFKPSVESLPYRNETPAVAMLVHDLRGCLQGVVGGVELLETAELEGDARAQTRRIVAAAQTLEHLLTMMVGEDGDADRATDQVDVDAILDYLGRRWGGEASQRGMRLTLAPDPDLPRSLRVERVALVRALGNLIGNALKYGGDGRAGGSVQVTVERIEDGGIAFRVADDGPGLDAPVLEAALRRGVAPAGSPIPSHGLGLHIVKDLTERIGGSLAFETPESGGLAASLVFPGALCRAGAPAAKRPPGRPDLGGLRLLLAEDNPTNQMVATQMLRALGAEVTVASDGVEALEAFEQAAFDLLVVDIEMPRLSGLDVIRRVRGRGDARAGVPIVALTAYALREHRERIAEAGANGLVSKPITSIDALGRALLAHVEPRNEAAPFDRAAYEGMRRSMGAEMAALLEQVARDLGTSRDILLAARPGLERDPIRSASHNLISVSGPIGAVRLEAQARALNQATHEAGDAALTRLLEACLGEVEAALAFVRRELAAG